MDCWKEGAESQFNKWSSCYDRSVLQRLFFRPSHDLFLKKIQIPAYAHVLDVGCGTGLFATRILREHPKATVVGLDLAEGMLAGARANCSHLGRRIEFLHGDAEQLPFDDDSFDLVTCIHSFHHYPNQGLVLREMHRVLRPGGQLVILDANRDGWWGWVVFDGVVTAIERNVHHCSAFQFKNLFESAGFSDVQQIPGGLVAPFLINRGVALKEAAAKRATIPMHKAA